MSTPFNKLKSPYNTKLRDGKVGTPSVIVLPGSLSQSGRYVLLSDDIVYAILTAASNMIKSDLDRRETLFALCRVCHVWSRAAQSLLFRHVFVQIRSSMMALLKVIDHKTERGRRLAGSIRAATIKLSKFPESMDPPSLPMIHPRHIPALLCHMPNLGTLDLFMGWEAFSPGIMAAISRGPYITALTLAGHQNRPTLTLDGNHNSPLSQILIGDTNPWPHLECVTVQNIDSSRLSCILERSTRTKIRLTHIAIDRPSDKNSEDFYALIQYSKDTLTHISLGPGDYDCFSNYLSHPIIRNIRSLTLGCTWWNNGLLDALHMFNDLKELRLVSSVHLERPFPSNLPDTIEHLLVAIPFLPVSNSYYLRPVMPDMARPALLKSFTAIVLRHPAHAYENNSYIKGEAWANEYVRYCEYHGIVTEIRKVADTSFTVQMNGLEVPPRTHRPNGTFQPTPSQLDLTDFEAILGARKVAERYRSNQSTVQASPQRRTGLDSFTPFASIRDLVTSWTGTRSTEDH